MESLVVAGCCPGLGMEFNWYTVVFVLFQESDGWVVEVQWTNVSSFTLGLYKVPPSHPL